MQPWISPVLFSLLLFLGMLAMLDVGRRFYMRHLRVLQEADKGHLATIETAVFALFGLLIAFTFSGASSRFQEKRTLIADEANAIETAYMRIDFVAPKAQAGLRERFLHYMDARLEMYRHLPDMEAAGPSIARWKQLQGDIWAGAVAATRLPGEDPGGARLLLLAINQMNQTARTRMVELQNHPPGMVYGLLLLLGLLCALLAGIRFTSGLQRNWLHMVMFPLVTSAVVYLTLDIEYPRIGLVRLDRADQTLVELRDSMKARQPAQAYAKESRP